jgi:hypothetical protein
MTLLQCNPTAPQRLRIRLRRWLRRETGGSVAVEFVIVFPVLVMFFLFAFESGVFLLRSTMVARATDMTFRDMRMGTLPDTSIDALRTLVCDRAGIILDCSQLTFQMQAVTPGGGQILQPTSCDDQTISYDPILQFRNTDISRKVVVVQACALFDPVFKLSALTLPLTLDAYGRYAIISRTAFASF